MTARRLVIAATLLIGATLPGRVEADFGDFTYTSTVNAALGPSIPPNPPGSVSESVDIGNGNFLTFTAKTNGQGDAAIPGGADIEVGRVIFEPSVTSSIPTAYEVSYNFLVTLTDTASAASGQFNFTGTFSGFATGSGGGSSPSINSTTVSFAVAPSLLVLGGVPYEIKAKPPAGPGSGGGPLSPGLFQVNITAVPEPGALVLLGIGGAGALVMLRPRRRAAA